jgi:hypothetical protein
MPQTPHLTCSNRLMPLHQGTGRLDDSRSVGKGFLVWIGYWIRRLPTHQTGAGIRDSFNAGPDAAAWAGLFNPLLAFLGLERLALRECIARFRHRFESVARDGFSADI